MSPHLKFLPMTKFSPRTMSVASATNIRYELLCDLEIVSKAKEDHREQGSKEKEDNEKC